MYELQGRLECHKLLSLIERCDLKIINSHSAISVDCTAAKAVDRIDFKAAIYRITKSRGER